MSEYTSVDQNIEMGQSSVPFDQFLGLMDDVEIRLAAIRQEEKRLNQNLDPNMRVIPQHLLWFYRSVQGFVSSESGGWPYVSITVSKDENFTNGNLDPFWVPIEFHGSMHAFQRLEGYMNVARHEWETACFTKRVGADDATIIEQLSEAKTNTLKSLRKIAKR